MTMTMVRGCATVCCTAGLLHRYIRMNVYAIFDAIVAKLSITNEKRSGGLGVIRQRTV